MTYRLEFTGSARRQLNTMPERVVHAVIEFCAGPLVEEPRRVGKPLTNELTGLWSARRGEYRIVYRIDDDRVVVEVARVRHRADAYR
ncbi:MAG: type II toxin-antitoxin system RelE/ParE family toxin [Kineosporiaceae bacterium]